MKNSGINAACYRLRGLVYLVSAISFLSAGVQAQNFEHAYGSMYEDNAQAIIPAFDGGYLMAGYTLNSASSPGNSYDILVVKTDFNGNIIWSKTIGSTVDDQAFWIEATADSAYLICGTMSDNTGGLYDDFIIRLDTSGTILSQKIYSVNHKERAFCVRETNDGGFVVAGETVSGSIDSQFHLFKTDAAGSILWSKAFGDTEDQSAGFVEQTNDHGYILCGTSRFGLTWSSIFIVKTDSSGNLQWSKKYNTQPYLSRCDVSRVLETSDGGYIVSGATNANQPLKSIMLMKIDSTGSVVWQRLYGTGRGERNSDIIPETNGYLVCGSTGTTSGYDNLMVMKTDSTGNLLWDLAYGVQDSNSIAYSLVKSNSGRFVIAGITDTYGAGDTDFLLLKSDSIFGSAGALCNIKHAEILPDTVTLVATPSYALASVSTLSSNGNFTAMTGIQETLICSQTSGISSQEQQVKFEIVPNPFSESTSLTFKITEQNGDASIVIYDSYGREIKYLVDKSVSVVRQFRFSRNEDSVNLSSGIYHFIFATGKYRSAGKIVLADSH